MFFFTYSILKAAIGPSPIKIQHTVQTHLRHYIRGLARCITGTTLKVKNSITLFINQASPISGGITNPSTNPLAGFTVESKEISKQAVFITS